MTATRRAHGPTETVSAVSLPADARELSTLSRIDYHDCFRVSADVERSPQEWIRVALTEAPPHVRRGLLLGWTALGLRLAPWSSHRVLGWKLLHADDRYVLLGADSYLGLHGQLLFRTEPEGLLFATFVKLTTPAARAVWAAITARHQRVVRSLLKRAAR